MIVLDPVAELVSTTELGQGYPEYLGQSPTTTPSFLMPSTTQSASRPMARVPKNVDLNPSWAKTLQLLLAFPPRTLFCINGHWHFSLKIVTLYWSMLLWSVSSLGNLSTTVTWSRQTSPTHSTGFMLALRLLAAAWLNWSDCFWSTHVACGLGLCHV